MQHKSTAREILGLMKQVRGKLERRVRAGAPDHGLTFTQLSVLACLNHNGKMRISDLSEKLGLTNSTTSGIVDRMVKIGLVSRSRSAEDRRVVYVALSETRRNLAQDIESHLKALILELFGRASEEDLNHIVRGLERLNVILGND